VAVPMSVLPRKYSTFVSVPLPAVTLTASVMLAGAVKLCPSVGLVRLTVGGAAVTVILRALLVVTAPLSSVAFAALARLKITALL
jgi:hypothetical protein